MPTFADMFQKMRGQGDTAFVLVFNSSDADEVSLKTGLGLLSHSELLRYQAFIRPLRQQQFLLGRILLRLALNQLLEVPMTEISLTERPGNSPLLNGFERYQDLGFSISHSGAWVGCAVSLHGKLGLDMEVLDSERDFPALALHAFDAEEYARFAASVTTSRIADFYSIWTAKEASIKLPAAVAQCQQFPHASLSISLCSSRPVSASCVQLGNLSP